MEATSESHIAIDLEEREGPKLWGLHLKSQEILPAMGCILVSTVHSDVDI